MLAMNGASRWLDAFAGLIPVSALAALSATSTALDRMRCMCLSVVISERNESTYGSQKRLDAELQKYLCECIRSRPQFVYSMWNRITAGKDIPMLRGS